MHLVLGFDGQECDIFKCRIREYIGDIQELHLLCLTYMTELFDELGNDGTTSGQPIEVEVECSIGIGFLLVLQEEIVGPLLLYFVFIG